MEKFFKKIFRPFWVIIKQFSAINKFLLISKKLFKSVPASNKIAIFLKFNKLKTAIFARIHHQKQLSVS